MTAPVQVFQVGLQASHVHKGAIGGDSFRGSRIHGQPIMTERHKGIHAPRSRGVKRHSRTLAQPSVPPAHATVRGHAGVVDAPKRCCQSLTRKVGRGKPPKHGGVG